MRDFENDPSMEIEIDEERRDSIKVSVKRDETEGILKKE